MRQSVLHSSPGCRVEGAVGGVAREPQPGMVGTAIRAACAQNTQSSGEFYSGYDAF